MPAQANIPALIPEPQFLLMEQFSGLNTKATRSAIEDQESSWLENWMPIGPGNLRTMRGKGATVYTATGGKIIVFFYSFNIGSTQYAAVFLNDGTADQVNLGSMAVTPISATPGTFYNGGDHPDVSQYGNTGILIVTTASANGYYAWDGTLYSPGGPAPTWLSGLTTPLTPTGNTHSNTTVDTISSMTGIEVGMSISGTGIPANTTITALPGGSVVTISHAAVSSLSTITLTITFSMPTGVAGTAIEIFQSRVWVTNGTKILFTAPANGANFSPADGGGVITSTDAFLKQHFVQLRQSSGFLYLFGDSSTNVISNVQTSGSPLSTTFNNLNVDPQVGTPWHDSVLEFGEGLALATTSGIHVVYGGAVKKVSDKLDGIFAAANLPLTGANLPSSAVATIFGIRVYILLLPGAVDYLGVSRPLMMVWDGKKFWVASQEVGLTFITTQEVQSQLNAYGTDGTNIFSLFNTASPTLKKIIQGKLSPGDSYIVTKQALRAYMQIQDNNGSGTDTTFEVDTENTNRSINFSGTNIIQFVNNSGGTIQFINSGSSAINFTAPGQAILAQNADIGGQLLGLTLSTLELDVTLISASLMYRNLKALA